MKVDAMARNFQKIVRNLTQFKANSRTSEKMVAWQIHSYGEPGEELKLSKTCRIPHVHRPTQLLVKVNAASVNPIDVAMIGGYGATALNLMRNIDNVEFPLTLGRDFCGTVVSKGRGGDDCQLPLGSAVWGVVPVHQQGCHAEYVLVDSSSVGEKPSELNNEEAASILYAGLTAWSGLVFSAGLKLHDLVGLKALVLGASGGVGNAAVQILKNGGAQITATCARDAVTSVETLGVANVFDYSASNFDEQIADCGRFDLVVDCAGLGSDFATSKFLQFRSYVTFTTPLLKNFDSLGLVRGTVASINNLICPNIQALKNGSLIKWAYFVPNKDGINFMHKLVQSGNFVPNVEKVFKFEDLPSAYQRVKDGHLRGKIVVSMDNEVEY